MDLEFENAKETDPVPVSPTMMPNITGIVSPAEGPAVNNPQPQEAPTSEPTAAPISSEPASAPVSTSMPTTSSSICNKQFMYEVLLAVFIAVVFV